VLVGHRLGHRPNQSPHARRLQAIYILWDACERPNTRTYAGAASHADQACKHQLRAAWAQDDHARALDGLRRLAAELDHHHPSAAASLREGLEETVTLTRLGITGNLRTTLQSTNAFESMISILRRISRNVKRWQNGDMCLRWTAAGMLEAEQQFRKIIGYSDLAKLAVAVERDLVGSRSSTTQPTAADPAATLVGV